jgi:hypothetical protein
MDSNSQGGTTVKVPLALASHLDSLWADSAASGSGIFLDERCMTHRIGAQRSII